jgi:hypothetical protein
MVIPEPSHCFSGFLDGNTNQSRPMSIFLWTKKDFDWILVGVYV